MKIRTGFVSNSSSSSFVVATEAGEVPVVTFSLDPFLTIHSEEELDKLLEEGSDGELDYQSDETIDSIRRALQEGKHVHTGSIDRVLAGCVWGYIDEGKDSNYVVLDAGE